MKRNSDLISTPEEVKALALELSNVPEIAFDTEFIRETTFYPQLEIIQIATEDQVWLIDVPAFLKRENGITELEPLLDIFENPKILKIAHAVQGDQECLYSALGIVAKPSFDTAAGASLCGYGENIGLGSLLKAILGVKLRKGHSRTHWAVRPLPPQLIEYAKADVEFLVKTAKKLMAELKSLHRLDWAMELSAKWEDKALYEPNPDELAEKLFYGGRIDEKHFGVLLELVRWRERRIRDLNIPRRWLADDGVLIDLTNSIPKDIAHLQTFRGLNKNESKKSGAEILKVIQAGLALETDTPEFRKRQRTASTNEGQAVELLKCYVTLLADQNRLSSKHLLSGNKFLTLLRSDPKTVEDLVKSGILTQGAADLIGKELIDLLHGKISLKIKDRGLHVHS